MSFFTKCLNAVGLHTEAELAAARREAAPSASAEAQAADIPAVRRPTTVEVLYRRTAEDIAEMPVSLQVQAKARAVDKLVKMRDKSMISAAEFETWKRRIMML